MIKGINFIRIEFIRLFRHSNVLFLFLAFHLLLSPLSLIHQIGNETLEINLYYEYFSKHFSIFTLMIVALFFVNSAGNDFTEGSYRKLIAMGMKRVEYIIGKFVLLLIMSIVVILLMIVLTFLFGVFSFDYSFSDLLEAFLPVSVLNQLMALTCAGLFGLFIIVLFRNRVIGLVFIPFWLSAEFSLRILSERDGTLQIVNYLPGNACYNLYSEISFHQALFLKVFFLCTFFLVGIILIMNNREERGKQLQ